MQLTTLSADNDLLFSVVYAATWVLCGQQKWREILRSGHYGARSLRLFGSIARGENRAVEPLL